MKRFTIILWRYGDDGGDSYGLQNHFAPKILTDVIDHRLTKINRHLEMINHFNGMKIAWENLLSFHTVYQCLCTKTLDGVLSNFAERW